MDYSKEIKLEINATGELPVVRIKQGDAYSRFIIATLTKDGVDYIPESDIQVQFRCQKPDGHGVMEDSTYEDTELGRKFVIINDEDGTISVELVEQVSTAVGRCRCDLCLVKDEHILSSIPFVIDVVASPDIASLAVSSDDFRTLMNTLGEFDRLEDEVMSLQNTIQYRSGSLTIPASGWTGDDPYTQNITVSGYTVTARTKADLIGDETIISAMQSCGAHTMFIVNNNGTLTVKVVGGKPTTNLRVGVALVETSSL